MFVAQPLSGLPIDATQPRAVAADLRARTVERVRPVPQDGERFDLRDSRRSAKLARPRVETEDRPQTADRPSSDRAALAGPVRPRQSAGCPRGCRFHGAAARPNRRRTGPGAGPEPRPRHHGLPPGRGRAAPLPRSARGLPPLRLRSAPQFGARVRRQSSAPEFGARGPPPESAPTSAGTSVRKARTATARGPVQPAFRSPA